MLLYVHVPFCRAKCRYCAFYSRPLSCGTDEALDAWTSAVEADLAAWAETLKDEGRSRRVTSIFFGGGTPSLLEPAMMGRLLDAAARRFDLAPDAEISMEANPESMTPDKARDFRAAGVSRVSLGVQALDDELLRAVGRVHSKAGALAAFDGLRRAGFGNVGLDFIWGLPGESLASWRVQIEEAAALGPEHLSCYGLTLEEGTPMWAERERLALPDEGTQAAMYADCGEILEKHGYVQYEISNYAKPGYECRHNLGYWLGEDYLGLGPSAVSSMGGQRWSQPDDLGAWLNAPRGQRPVGELCEALSFREQAEELVMLRLRTARGLPLGEYRRFTGRDFAVDNAALIAALEAEGLAHVTHGPEPHFALTRAGMLISNAVIGQCFDNIPEQRSAAHDEQA